jgi:hypothetical protein
MPLEPRVHALEKFVLRLPDGMREKIGVAARANKRTMNAEIVQRLEASFSPTGEPLLVINKNTAEADIVWELRDSMQSLQAEVNELRANLTKVTGGEADPEYAGVPDFTDEKGMAIFETRQMVRELLESVKALTKSPRPEEQSKKDLS